MEKINCIAVDDEPLCLQQIINYIERVEFLNLVASFDNGFDALNYLKTREVDLIFLDIQMDELTGVDLIESLHSKPDFIFTTAFDHYALKAFELQAVDYIQKPLSFKRFMQAVDKFIQVCSKPAHQTYTQPEESQRLQTSRKFIFIKTKYKMQRLSFDDIYYIKGLNNYLIIKTRDENLYIIQSFRQFSQVLPPENFVRIHKSYIVAIDKIDIIGKNQVIVQEQNLPIGESYKEYFFNYLEKSALMLQNAPGKTG